MQVAEANAAQAKVRELSRGRKDKQGQEKVIELSVLTERMANLITLQTKAKTAGKEYGEAIKVVSEKAGLLSSVVRKFVAARASEMYSERKTEAQQLEMLFEEIGQ